MSGMSDFYIELEETKMNELALNHMHMSKQEILDFFMWVAEEHANCNTELIHDVVEILPKQVYGHDTLDIFEMCQKWVAIRNTEKVAPINGFDDLDDAAFTLEMSNNCRHGVTQYIDEMLSSGISAEQIQKKINKTAEKILRNPDFFKL